MKEFGLLIHSMLLLPPSLQIKTQLLSVDNNLSRLMTWKQLVKRIPHEILT